MDEGEDFANESLDEMLLLEPSSQGSLTDAAANLFLDREPHIINHTSRPQAAQDRVYPNAGVIDKIEAVFEKMADALLNDKTEISLTLRNRQQESRRRSGSESVVVEPVLKQLSFPGKTADEAWRFTVVLRILELMHEALRNDVVISKRDIYYRDPALFGSQVPVDRYVDDIAFTFAMPRSSLSVVAAAKGLVAGAARIHRKDGTSTDLTSGREGILVPNLKDIMSVEMPDVDWILVIEKEATFRSVAASSFWTTIASRGIIITGKGYPDLSTRAFVQFLSTPSIRNNFASPLVQGLADYDPDGIAILSVYRTGSRALSHESKNHAVPQLKWLGLRSRHLHIVGHEARIAQGLLTLTARDRKKALQIMDQVSNLDSKELEKRQELQTMLMLNAKAELQLLDTLPNGMVDLLFAELGNV